MHYRISDCYFILISIVYKIKPETGWIVEYYGSWTTTGGLNKSQERIISNAVRRKDLKKKYNSDFSCHY